MSEATPVLDLELEAETRTESESLGGDGQGTPVLQGSPGRAARTGKTSLIVGQTSVVDRGDEPGAKRGMDAKILFFLGLLMAASGLVSPPVALVGGIVYGFAVEHPLRREASSLAKLLLQISVILLGFGMNLHQVVHAGRSGFLYTACSIGLAVML